MRYSSHCRAIDAPPCYQADRYPPSREALAFTLPAFPNEFHGTQNARKCSASPRSDRTSPVGAEPASTNPWSIALAVMLVANLVAPPVLATPMLPRRSERQPEGDSAPGIATAPPPEAQTQAGYDIERHPLDLPRVKSSYTVQEFLRAIAMASAPFRNLGRMVSDAYEAVSGEQANPPAVATAERVGSVADAATGLIPKVQLARLPGRVAEVSADALQGRLPQPSTIADLLQFGDPRSYGSHAPAPHEAPPDQPVLFRRAPVFDAFPDEDIDIGPAADFPADENPSAMSRAATLEGDDERLGPLASAPINRPGGPGGLRTLHSLSGLGGLSTLSKLSKLGSLGGRGGRGGRDAPDAAAIPDALDAPDASDSAEAALHIEGEHEYLQGYEQTLPLAQIPTGSRRQLVTLDGRHYLAGKSGYYHVSPGRSADHWLINAPRGTRAQIPVTYDAQTHTWRADAPLRLCGGGCGPSRESTPDSVGMSKNEVAEAIRHIADRDVRDAIQQAYSDLAHLHLMRTNREDLRALRDNSIVVHRRVLVPQLMRLDPHSTLLEQQREAALITTIHYDNYSDHNLLDLSPEAFCQENAEILFHYLLMRGVSSNNIRMITVRSQGRPPHVMVLYTESDPFIDLLDLTTPQPPIFGHDDGIPGDMFAGALFLSRSSTVLLDPWSRIKASSFPWVNDADDVRRMLEVSLADTGRIPGSPFTVSLTRPYPAPRERSISSSGSSISMRSQGSSAGDSIRSGPSRRDPPDSPPPDADRDTPL